MEPCVLVDLKIPGFQVHRFPTRGNIRPNSGCGVDFWEPPSRFPFEQGIILCQVFIVPCPGWINIGDGTHSKLDYAAPTRWPWPRFRWPWILLVKFLQHRASSVSIRCCRWHSTNSQRQFRNVECESINIWTKYYRRIPIVYK